MLHPATISCQIIFTAIDSNIDPPQKAEKPPLLNFKLQRIMFCHALNRKECQSMLKYYKKNTSIMVLHNRNIHMEYARHDWFNTHSALPKVLKMHWDAKTKRTSSYGTSFAAFTETFLH